MRACVDRPPCGRAGGTRPCELSVDWIGTIRTALQEGCMGCTLLYSNGGLDSVRIRTTLSSAIFVWSDGAPVTRTIRLRGRGSRSNSNQVLWNTQNETHLSTSGRGRQIIDAYASMHRCEGERLAGCCIDPFTRLVSP